MNIQISNLTKRYGQFTALDRVSLEIPGGMFGLLGPNGAGKTTLMRILTTLTAPTEGTVTVGGHSVTQYPEKIRRRLGYLPQDFGFYKGLNAYELLDYIASMKNLPKGPERKRQIEAVLEQVNLTGDARRKVGGYSGGMKQRLGIAQALLGDPQLLVVDEPTSGLDPEERIRFRNLLSRLASQRTVILSTHIVADVEASCTGLAVLNKGRLVFSGTPEQLAEQAQSKVWQVEASPEEAELLSRRYRVLSSRRSGGVEQVRLLADENPLQRGEPVLPGLEEGYLAVMGGA